MTIVALIVAALIAVQSPAVQTYMADKILASLKNSIDGDITIGKIHVAPFNASSTSGTPTRTKRRRTRKSSAYRT